MGECRPHHEFRRFYPAVRGTTFRKAMRNRQTNPVVVRKILNSSSGKGTWSPLSPRCRCITAASGSAGPSSRIKHLVRANRRRLKSDPRGPFLPSGLAPAKCMKDAPVGLPHERGFRQSFQNAANDGPLSSSQQNEPRGSWYATGTAKILVPNCNRTI